MIMVAPHKLLQSLSHNFPPSFCLTLICVLVSILPAPGAFFSQKAKHDPLGQLGARCQAIIRDTRRFARPVLISKRVVWNGKLRTNVAQFLRNSQVVSV